MRVGLISLTAAGPDGIPRYATQMVMALDSVASEFPELEFVVVAHGPSRDKLALTRLEVVVPRAVRPIKATRGPARIVADQLAAATCHCDVVHFFDLIYPLLRPRKPFVATMHDAAPAHRLGGSPKLHKRLMVPAAARRARALIAVSAFAKAEAVEHYHADPGRVHVVHSGPGLVKDTSNPAGEAEPRQRRASGDYLLYVGSLFEHKNLVFLVRAFEQVSPEVELVLVGSRAHASAELESALSQSSAAGRIHFVENASDSELDGLYRDALGLVLPSVYEGFGLTALEAMSRGCPALVSDIPALREVCGDGALLLPVSDEQAWVQAITRLLDPADGLREQLQRSGPVAASPYSWLKAARAVCHLYGELARVTAVS